MLTAIHLIVKDGEKYIRKCLEAALNQDLKDYAVLVFDNNSRDKTREIIEREFPKAKLVRFDKNYGLGGGFNRSLAYSDSKYVVLLCVDIILAPNFLSEAIKAMENDSKIGALQPKVFQWDFEQDKLTDIIDTTGFQMFKSRRLINRGHGEKDTGQYRGGEIFSYEGASPVFRRKALNDSMLNLRSERVQKSVPELLDEDFQWYADDSDLGWRMRLFGWKSYYSPTVIAWHDRQTTKALQKNYFDFIRIRRAIPWKKRMLDWRNQRLTMVKNESLSNFLKDFPHFLKREIPLILYFIFFEPRTIFQGLIGFFQLFPVMHEKRNYIMRNKKITNQEIQKWFI